MAFICPCFLVQQASNRYHSATCSSGTVHQAVLLTQLHFPLLYFVQLMSTATELAGATPVLRDSRRLCSVSARLKLKSLRASLASMGALPTCTTASRPTLSLSISRTASLSRSSSSIRYSTLVTRHPSQTHPSMPVAKWEVQ